MSIMAICRSADQPRKPGTFTGYFCSACQKELAVTSTAVEAIKAGARPFCNPCGFELYEELDKRDLLAGTVYSPEAIETLTRFIERREKARNN